MTANPQYSTIKNNYELTFDIHSDIRLSTDENGIKKATYKFVKISDIAGLDIGAMIGKHFNLDEKSNVLMLLFAKYELIKKMNS